MNGGKRMDGWDLGVKAWCGFCCWPKNLLLIQKAKNEWMKKTQMWMKSVDVKGALHERLLFLLQKNGREMSSVNRLPRGHWSSPEKGGWRVRMKSVDVTLTLLTE
jgi:hypothetical protein